MSDSLSKEQQQQVKEEVNKQLKQRLSKHLSLTKFKNEFKQQTSTAIIAAFGLLVALSWKDVVTKVVDNVTTPALVAAHPYIAAVYTALIITVIAVLGIAVVSHWSKKDDPQTVVAVTK